MTDSTVINSFGLTGKIISKNVEVRENKVLDEKQRGEALERVPAQLVHCTKIEGVLPTKHSVISNVDYNLSTQKKKVTYKKEKHIYDNPTEKGASKKYKHTVITEEQFTENISQSEMNHIKKNSLFEKLNNEVGVLDLSTIKSKEDVLQFANGEGYISNTEKKRRAVLLLNCLCERYRITSRDIASL